MKICVLSVPYDSGRRAERMGAGPLELIDRGLEARLEGDGHRVRHETIELNGSSFPIEVQAAFELKRKLAEQVRRAIERDEVPLVLSGNCNAAVGAMAGIGADGTGLAWFDAHGDINTPETTPSGYLDGMGLAVLLGWCWRGVAATIPGFEPLREENAMLLGVRDLDPEEAQLAARSEVRVLDPAQVRDELEAKLEELAQRVEGIYVHLDLDVLDPSEGQANNLPVPDGLTVDELEHALGRIKRRIPIRGVGLGSYDPTCDEDGAIAGAALRLLGSLLAE